MRQRIPVTPVPERPPDVEAFFSFNDVRKSPARDGYRPAHRLTDTCLTTGVHHYYDVDSVPPNASARGMITFLSPEAYPHCLWVGKRIPMQEGARVVGYATITRIDNPLLQAENAGNAARPTLFHLVFIFSPTDRQKSPAALDNIHLLRVIITLLLCGRAATGAIRYAENP